MHHISWLLGAKDERHVEYHPLRGNLFENLVILEALKYQYHRGERSNLFFWRDGKGNEVDLLVENGLDIVPVEIKSGATISNDYCKGLRTFAGKLSGQPKTCALVYGGAERQKRNDVTIWRAMDVSMMMECIRR